MYRNPRDETDNHRIYSLDPFYDGIEPLSFIDNEDLAYKMGLSTLHVDQVGFLGTDAILRIRKAFGYGVEFLDSGRKIGGALLVAGIHEGRIVSAKTPLWELHQKVRLYISPVPFLIRLLKQHHIRLSETLEYRWGNGIRIIGGKQLAQSMKGLNLEISRQLMHIFHNAYIEGFMSLDDILGDAISIITKAKGRHLRAESSQVK